MSRSDSPTKFELHAEGAHTWVTLSDGGPPVDLGKTSDVRAAMVKFLRQHINLR